jgi:Raf kinase inhibitor-like YbhB/YbcL family protein
MKLSSNQFENQGQIPAKYTCDGQNISPPLEIKEIPENAQSLVLICDDPDAPAGTWVHWTLWNIEPNDNKIEENTKPQNAIEGITSFNSIGYGGPCPPSGTHRYFFKLYALDVKLELDQNSKIEDLEKNIEGHILESAELIGLYKRE